MKTAKAETRESTPDGVAAFCTEFVSVAGELSREQAEDGHDKQGAVFGFAARPAGLERAITGSNIRFICRGSTAALTLALAHVLTALGDTELIRDVYTLASRLMQERALHESPNERKEG